jgi:purine-binding chemotaxis protein CheW
MSLSLSEISSGLPKDNGENQLVVFTLAGCELAVGIRQVREIIRVSQVTLMPKAPKFLEGILNLRGRIIPVLDLKKRFDMPLVDKTDETRVLVVEIKDQLMGLLVDKVVEVLRIPAAAIQPPTEAVLTIAPEYIAGLATLEDRLILLFQLEKLFTFDEIKSLPDLEATS